MKMRRFATTACVVGVLMAIAPAALAANVHFKREPAFTDQGTTLKVSGALAGLGNKDVTIKVTALGIATSITCTNPAGKKAPGQNKPQVRSLGEQTIERTEIKNGNVSFSFTTADPAQLTARQAGCPNNNWTATINDVDFSSARITVVQGGEVVLDRTFTI